MTAYNIDPALLRLKLIEAEKEKKREKYRYKIGWLYKILSWVGI